MSKHLVQTVFVLICLFILTAEAQVSADGFTLKPEWKQYLLTPQKIAVSFPKFPTVDFSAGYCESWERYRYATFADDVVYTAVVTREAKSASPLVCGNIRKFGQATFDERIAELLEKRNLARNATADDDKLKNRVRLSNDKNQVVLIQDLPNKRFIELWITSDQNRLVDESVFFESFSTEPKPNALDVKGGVVRTIGDDLQRTTDSLFWKGIKPSDVNYGVLLVHKPKALYTDKARRKKEQGVVQLQVSLLASGSVGTITPTKSLRYGLTEQAIHAASRIVFIPKKVSGVNVSSVVTIEYGFNLY